MVFIVKDFKFNKVDIKAFERIWDSDYSNNYVDSWQSRFSETVEEDWRPFFERASINMREVILNNEKIGYIFISPKNDGTAHLGYGIYKEHRGKGLSVAMCKQYLEENVSSLDKKIAHLVGTTLKENIVSIKVLEKLGFKFYEEITENHNDVEIPYLQYRMEL